jgi:hypothetical protein
MTTLAAVHCRIKDCDRLSVSLLAGGGFQYHRWFFKVREVDQPCRTTYGEEFTRPMLLVEGYTDNPGWLLPAHGRLPIDLFFVGKKKVRVALEGLVWSSACGRYACFTGTSPIIEE